MKLTNRGVEVAISLASIMLAIGYIQGGLVLGAFFAVALGGLWYIGHALKWRYLASFELTVFFGLAAVGTFFDINFIWLLVGMGSALAAWDLDQFSQRMERFPIEESFLKLEQNHFRRLLVILIPGTILAAVVPTIQIELTFTWALILGLIAIYGLSQTVKYLRRESD